jgi:hypothetical protein
MILSTSRSHRQVLSNMAFLASHLGVIRLRTQPTPAAYMLPVSKEKALITIFLRFRRT